MVKRYNKLPTPSGVAVDETATFDIPVGPRYHVLWLQVGCTAKLLVTEIINEIRIKVNGKVQRTFTADELEQLNALMGDDYIAHVTLDGQGAGSGHVVSTRLPIFLAEPWRKMVAAQDGLAWGTGDLSSLQVEVDIDAGAAGVTLSGRVELDNSITAGKDGAQTQASIGVINKWFRQQIPINGTTADIQSFPRRDFYQQISFFDPDITSVLIKVENFTIREITKEENDALLISRGMVPSEDRFDLVFDHDDIIDSALPMVVSGRAVQDFQVQLTLSDGTARNISTIAQRLGAPE